MPIDVAKLGSVQKTLLLPLWGRAVETHKKHPRLVDQTAAAIVSDLDYDFAAMARNISIITQLAWIARSLHVDRALREFLGRNPQAAVVNLGCGLDTTFERVDNGQLLWYDLDLPDVIALRRKFIPDAGRRRSIASSLLDDGWLAQLDADRSVFFIAAGVLYYLTGSDVRALLIKLAGAFPGSQILFDACSSLGLKAANKSVIEAGGMDESAMLRWSLDRAGEIHSWDERLDVLAEYPIFHNFKRGFTLREKWGMFLSDRLKIMSMIHLRLG